MSASFKVPVITISTISVLFIEAWFSIEVSNVPAIVTSIVSALIANRMIKKKNNKKIENFVFMYIKI